MTHISERGQLVIPKYFREMLGWETDTLLRLGMENNKLVIEKHVPIGEELEQFAREHGVDLKGKHDFDDEYDDVLRKKFKKMGLKY